MRVSVRKDIPSVILCTCRIRENKEKTIHARAKLYATLGSKERPTTSGTAPACSIQNFSGTAPACSIQMSVF